MKRYINNNGVLECDYLFDGVERAYTTNYINIPITAYQFDEDNCKNFNHILSCLRGSYLKEIERTEKGTIPSKYKNMPAYSVVYSGGCIEILIINYNGSFRLQWRNSCNSLFDDGKLTISGKKAFLYFNNFCKKFGIELYKYAHNDKEKALKEKEEIEPPMIMVADSRFIDKKLYNCHHIDFHSSYMGGLAITHPEFREVVEYIYSKRKDDDMRYKAILNMTQGYMQSKMVQYRFAHLSRDMIKNNNDRVRKLAMILTLAGRRPIVFNTDGLWYQGEIFHSVEDGEGKNVGEWENDHTNCILRVKSAGAYEFIEDDKYHPVIRGKTHLDAIRPREEWEWGDIYNKNAIEVKYSINNGYLEWENECKGVRRYEEEK